MNNWMEQYKYGNDSPGLDRFWLYALVQQYTVQDASVSILHQDLA
jgi:hypothetical protein